MNKTIRVELWICPTEGCDNHYASSSQRGIDLGKSMTGEKVENRFAFASKHGGDGTKHSRANCPDCRARGLDVERVPVMVSLPIRIPDAVVHVGQSPYSQLRA
jgi:hypothetical protein